ncbi:MAG: hypothetical protein EON58_11660 [Alphaproteobacteria bacterium]|nr:MAG: hypothetical protein EON58_11660 [Alphaproteobacteria bacterium]
MPVYGTTAAEILLEPLRDVGANQIGSEDIVLDLLFKTNLHNGFDKAKGLISILLSLKSLCGGSEEAAKWLVQSQGYTDITGKDAHHHLEMGEIWTFANMAAFLQILAKFKDHPEDLYKSLFNYTSYCPDRSAENCD